MKRRLTKKRKPQRASQIRLTVTQFNDGSAQVEIDAPEEVEHLDFMCATEFMMWAYAKQCARPFDDILESLCKGAKTYRQAIVQIPKRIGDNHDR